MKFQDLATYLDASICCSCIIGQVCCQLVHSGAHAHQLPQIGSRHLAHSTILQQDRQERKTSTNGRPLLSNEVVIHPLSAQQRQTGELGVLSQAIVAPPVLQQQRLGWH